MVWDAARVLRHPNAASCFEHESRAIPATPLPCYFKEHEAPILAVSLSAPPMLDGLRMLAHRLITVWIDKSRSRFEDGATEFQLTRCGLGPIHINNFEPGARSYRGGRPRDGGLCLSGCSCIAGCCLRARFACCRCEMAAPVVHSLGDVRTE